VPPSSVRLLRPVFRREQSDVIAAVIPLDQADPATAVSPSVAPRVGSLESREPPIRDCILRFQQVVAGLLVTTWRVPPVNMLLLTFILHDLST
jgi:hypothetical protein